MYLKLFKLLVINLLAFWLAARFILPPLPENINWGHTLFLLSIILAVIGQLYYVNKKVFGLFAPLYLAIIQFIFFHAFLIYVYPLKLYWFKTHFNHNLFHYFFVLLVCVLISILFYFIKVLISRIRRIKNQKN